MNEIFNDKIIQDKIIQIKILLNKIIQNKIILIVFIFIIFLLIIIFIQKNKNKPNKDINSEKTKSSEGTFRSNVPPYEIIDCPEGTYQDEIGKNSCKKCPIGTSHTLRRQTSLTSCRECPNSTYNDVEGGMCKNCPVGTSHELLGQISQTSCLNCSDGTYNNIEGRLCKNCPKGKQSNSDYTGCVDCPNSTYNDTEGGTCKNCPVGTSHELLRQNSINSCIFCNDGTYNDIEGGLCKNCPKGKQSNSDYTGCVDCPNSTYNDTEGEMCKNCPVGTFHYLTKQISVDSCDSCPVGKQPNSDNTGCIDCPNSTYNDTKGEMCKKCPVGTSHELTGQTSLDSCVDCPNSTYNDVEGEMCKNCPVGSYHELTGQISSSVCQCSPDYVTEIRFNKDSDGNIIINTKCVNNNEIPYTIEGSIMGDYAGEASLIIYLENGDVIIGKYDNQYLKLSRTYDCKSLYYYKVYTLPLPNFSNVSSYNTLGSNVTSKGRTFNFLTYYNFYRVVPKPGYILEIDMDSIPNTICLDEDTFKEKYNYTIIDTQNKNNILKPTFVYKLKDNNIIFGMFDTNLFKLTSVENSQSYAVIINSSVIGYFPTFTNFNNYVDFMDSAQYLYGTISYNNKSYHYKVISNN